MSGIQPNVIRYAKKAGKYDTANILGLLSLLSYAARPAPAI
jgi:hypothetical protein